MSNSETLLASWAALGATGVTLTTGAVGASVLIPIIGWFIFIPVIFACAMCAAMLWVIVAAILWIGILVEKR